MFETPARTSTILLFGRVSLEQLCGNPIFWHSDQRGGSRGTLSSLVKLSFLSARKRLLSPNCTSLGQRLGLNEPYHVHLSATKNEHLENGLDALFVDFTCSCPWSFFEVLFQSPTGFCGSTGSPHASGGRSSKANLQRRGDPPGGNGRRQDEPTGRQGPGGRSGLEVWIFFSVNGRSHTHTHTLYLYIYIYIYIYMYTHDIHMIYEYII